ncbi:hypothetical protein COCC4DRAFT_43816 [Bipolaris maydis ATCC 48331]|uniref:Uncharacterized protein n=2 Tax=Cochliobolus heterostrophus TaxID=5016 RepID=M2V300_COCH5|nr:uncharacterized protein COCC4DRAFT_43816 [Bipolaris maydis ATCC 48331]EMD94393.1 hypothetical protein COCHEDRAFT_1211808 [Bipolaris maydis C5]KAJ5026453.1 hypothetical protein J3E73DRAFT_306225 [Bipolaris maydis]ENI01267.1 hypothetical protein COCC4DRAFT_43816 [Bipolaris maydis ATCC 48331]KAJ5051080.1 hypothetical protein J3E74DRAFT_390345 [Bipolaris maydis]KAJ5059821.1 hypothetical protein J3E74DRAFT_350856 [Bipolaris maydis]
MSRRAVLMSLSAGVTEGDFQSGVEASVIDDQTNDQPLPPTATASQPTARVKHASSSKPSPRDLRRKVYWYTHLDPNNRNRARSNNVRDTNGVQRGAHEQRTHSNRLSENTRSNLQGRTSHAQVIPSSQYLPAPTIQIYNVHYHSEVTPYHVGLEPYAPGHFPRVVPNQLQNSRPIPYPSARLIVAHGVHEQAVGSQGRPQSQIQAQQQALETASAATQQQGFNFSARPIASSGHSNFPHVGVAITPPSSANAEPRPITRTQTLPARTTLEPSRSR